MQVYGDLAVIDTFERNGVCMTADCKTLVLHYSTCMHVCM